MAVTLRLTRKGRTKRPFYRIVAADKEKRRDGRFLELLGTYDVLQDPPVINLNQERAKYWIEKGAKPSPTVQHIISKEIPGYYEEIEKGRLAKIQAKRAKRKAAAK
ncbi:MAG: 30S ribosomal protein S16 [Bdellovibrionales bacterium]|nr:30S ribosomal protein S16 [Bdellovibrionales bacterium]